MTFLLVLLILVFSFVLIKSADMVIVGVRKISSSLGASSFTIAALVLAIGTSFPELFVGITSALENSPNLSLGVVIGSNIANIALIGSVAALLTGRIRIKGEYLRRDVYVAFFAGILPIILVFDRELSRIDGIILLSVYISYATGFFRERYEEIGIEQKRESFFYRFLRRFEKINSKSTKDFALLFVGIALMLFSADAIVKSSEALAVGANVPLFLIGLFAIAVGTSLPELAFSIKSLRGGEPAMFFGNLLGSTIANSTLIIGITSIISPIKIIAFNQYVVSVVAFIIIFTSFWIFIRTKRRLDRWEAVILLCLYAIFVFFEIR